MIASDDALRELGTENECVQLIRNSVDLLERMCTDSEGTDLRSCVSVIGELVNQIADENTLFGIRQQSILEKSSASSVAAVAPASFSKRNLSTEDRQVLRSMFDRALENNPNDDKARMVQLQIVFVGLTLLVDVRRQLMQQHEYIDRFEDDTTNAPTTVAERRKLAESLYNEQQRRRREQENLIPARPLLLFLQNNAVDLLSKHLDGKIDVKTYVEECMFCYLKYKPAMTPDIARQYRQK